jgi:3-dehydroquinate synthase
VTQRDAVVQVRLGERSYDIAVGTGNLASLADAVIARRRVTQATLIVDEAVEEPYARVAADSLSRAGVTVDILVVPSGETTKSVEAAAELWSKLLELGVDRKTLIVAIGGGVVGDLAGFVAATYARGLDFWQVPTTLLAQVDSSVGGKVGINLPGAKNMVGAFWQPLGVLIDTAVLSTLPDREYRAGLAEVVKYGVILDPELFAYLERHTPEINRRDGVVLEHVIVRCCQLKAGVVEADEREERGGRAILNYGHTFAHALEAVSGYGILLHGEAVSIGMMCAARLSRHTCQFATEDVARQQQLLVGLGLPVRLPQLDRTKLLAAMARDKKVEHGRLRFVLADRIGVVRLVDAVDENAVLDAMID